VHFGTQPEVDPVNRLFSSMVGTKFDTAMFLSAFDMKHDACGLAAGMTKGGQPTAQPDSPPWTASVRSTGNGTALVSLHTGNADTMDFAVREASGHWVIDKWVPPANVQMPVSFTGSPCDIYTTFLGATSQAADRATQSDLRNALTAEKTYYVDSEDYSGSASAMKQIEPSLAWGTKLTVTVGAAANADFLSGSQVVCLSETGTSGKTYALGDVAVGDQAGTYYGTKACPAHPSASAMAAMGSTPWGESSSGSSAPSSDPQSDLRNALTAEKVEYTDTQVYTADTKELKSIESSLDWGGQLQVVVGTSMIQDDTVCLSEAGFSIADVSAGDHAGTYYSHTPCPQQITSNAFTGWQTSW
jgi:hypothetical protein